MTIDKLYDLNEEFYKAYARLKKNTEFLTDKQYKTMADALTASYQKALYLMSLERDVEYKRNVFAIKRRIKRQVPKKFLFFKNREAKLMLKQIDDDYNLIAKMKENSLIENKETKENDDD